MRPLEPARFFLQPDPERDAFDLAELSGSEGPVGRQVCGLAADDGQYPFVQLLKGGVPQLWIGQLFIPSM